MVHPCMKPDNTPVDKENHLPKHHFFSPSPSSSGGVDTPKAPALKGRPHLNPNYPVFICGASSLAVSFRCNLLPKPPNLNKPTFI